MKQLTFILFLFFSFTFQNCSHEECKTNRNQEEVDNSRSIPNVNNNDCVEPEKLFREMKKNNIISEANKKDSDKKGFRLPDLKNEEFNQSDIKKIEVRTQSIFDDYDPDKI